MGGLGGEGEGWGRGGGGGGGGRFDEGLAFRALERSWESLRVDRARRKVPGEEKS